MSAKFGPAGNSDSFSKQYKSSLDAPGWIAGLGLACYEYQCGKGVHVGEETARKLGQRAKEAGIVLSLHAPYFINLANPDPESLQKTIGYITAACLAADQMGAGRVIVHSGALMKRSRREALDIARKSLEAVMTACDDSGFGHLTLCPETMGKINQLGDLDEVLELCTLDERLVPCIDFGLTTGRRPSTGCSAAWRKSLARSGPPGSTATFPTSSLPPTGERSATAPLPTTTATAPSGHRWPRKWPAEAGAPPLSANRRGHKRKMRRRCKEFTRAIWCKEISE